MDRQRNETMQQYRGRQKRELNAANDALNLQPGEPIHYGARDIRYSPSLIDRRRPTKISRLVGEDLEKYLAKEQETKKRHERIRLAQEAHEVFRARPEVRAAESIRYYIENETERILGVLTPEEWVALAVKFEGKS